MYTDACDTGWGVRFLDRENHGQWSIEESKLHINVKEIMAVYFGLITMLHDMSHTSVKLHIDNTVTVNVLKHMGTSHNPDLNQYARKVWLWARDRAIWLIPSYIPSSQNLADKPSRDSYIDAEWKLNPRVFREVCVQLDFYPDVDLFASRLNRQLTQYVSYHPDPFATATDAFSISWCDLKFYMFPPFSCISRCLQKIKQETASGIIIVPQWPTQPFYPVLLKMLIQPPHVIPKGTGNLLMPNQPALCSEVAAKSNLLACLISGQSS